MTQIHGLISCWTRCWHVVLNIFGHVWESEYAVICVCCFSLCAHYLSDMSVFVELYVAVLFVQVNINTWLWSTIFHTRDTDFTEVHLTIKLWTYCNTTWTGDVHAQSCSSCNMIICRQLRCICYKHKLRFDWLSPTVNSASQPISVAHLILRQF